MTLDRTTALVAAALLVVCAAPAGAQRTISPGQTVSGSLSAGDPVLDDGSHYHIYHLAAAAGQRYQITLRSDAFDAFLAFGPRVDEDCIDCEMDDDGAGGTDSRLRVTAGSSGTHQIRVNTLGPGETGPYTLHVETLAPLRVPTPQAIAIGQSVSGTLSSGDGELDDGSYYDLYRLSASPGQRVEITMRSSDVDAFLAGGTMSGGQFEALESDDDSGGDLDALIVVTVGSAGTYFIQANSLGEGETGSYTLSVREAAPLPPPAAIRVGQTVSGHLDASDARLPDGSHYDAYHITGRAGERVRITMRSGDFDAFLHVARAGADEDSLESDDDGAGGTDSRIDFTFPSAGVYEIRANSFIGGETGAYTLTVEPLG